jgi:GNAT superfamily N-acetyltransferase
VRRFYTVDVGTFREVAVTDAVAQAMLTEYFASRAETFPAAQGNYLRRPPAPDHFEPPHGVFLVVSADIDAESVDAGCGGIRAVAPSPSGAIRYEVKHVWVRPEFRGRGLGAELLAELERRARQFGATELVLDTNTSQAAAGRLYARSGYREIAPYNDNPNATTWYAKPLA